MTKYVNCTRPDCRAIGELKDTQMVKDHLCPLCGGTLQRINGSSISMLLHHSPVPLWPGVWNTNFEKSRQETTVKEYTGKPLPEIQVIRDIHPCEKCQWRGTYDPKG